jgi:hypothetical protein
MREKIVTASTKVVATPSFTNTYKEVFSKNLYRVFSIKSMKHIVFSRFPKDILRLNLVA